MPSYGVALRATVGGRARPRADTHQPAQGRRRRRVRPASSVTPYAASTGPSRPDDPVVVDLAVGPSPSRRRAPGLQQRCRHRHPPAPAPRRRARRPRSGSAGADRRCGWPPGGRPPTRCRCGGAARRHHPGQGTRPLAAGAPDGRGATWSARHLADRVPRLGEDPVHPLRRGSRGRPRGWTRLRPAGPAGVRPPSSAGSSRPAPARPRRRPPHDGPSRRGAHASRRRRGRPR